MFVFKYKTSLSSFVFCKSEGANNKTKEKVLLFLVILCRQKAHWQ
jgi:hypothetical protein